MEVMGIKVYVVSRGLLGLFLFLLWREDRFGLSWDFGFRGIF